MKTTPLLLLTIILSLNTVFAQENTDSQTSEGSYLELPWIQVVPLKDSRTGRQYELYIKLPEGYSENLQYPVLYYTDALWHVEILSASAEYLLEGVILVGVSWQKDITEEVKKEVGEHASRFRDYSTRESSNPEHQAKYQFGQAGDHLAFIRNDVIQYIENRYRTDPGRRSYFGYSLGGEFGAYVLLTQPDTFKNYILGSPSLKGDVPYLSGIASNTTLNANVFVSYGASEKELGEHAEQLIALLKNRNDERLSLTREVIEGNHQTAFPLTGVRSVTWLSGLIKE